MHLINLLLASAILLLLAACAGDPVTAPAARYEKPDAALMVRPAPLKDLPKGAGLGQTTLALTQCRSSYGGVADRLELLQNYNQKLVGAKPIKPKPAEAPTS